MLFQRNLLKLYSATVDTIGYSPEIADHDTSAIDLHSVQRFQQDLARQVVHLVRLGQLGPPHPGHLVDQLHLGHLCHPTDDNKRELGWFTVTVVLQNPEIVRSTTFLVVTTHYWDMKRLVREVLLYMKHMKSLYFFYWQ